MAHVSGRADDLLSSINESLKKLDDLESSYLRQKSELTEAIATAAGELGRMADSQAVRAQLLRELYWHKAVPVDIIAGAFGLKMHRAIQLAGALTMKFPCANGCGTEITKTFTSRSDRDTYIRERHGKRADFLRPHYLCDGCREAEHFAREREKIRQGEHRRSRDIQLRALPWDDYTETDEWIAFRNIYIHHQGFGCEVCHVGDVTIYAHLARASAQSHPEIDHDLRIVLLCKDCRVRCADLIDPEKFDVLKPEMERAIHDWYQNRRPLRDGGY